MTHVSQIKSFQNIQHLDDTHATGAGRWHADNLVATIGAAHRFALNRLVHGQILLGDQTTIGLHKGSQHAGILTPVETITPFVADPFKRPGQIRLLPGVPQLVRRSVRFKKNFCRAWELLPESLIIAEPTVQGPGYRYAVAGQLNGGIYQHGPRQCAVFLMRLIQACYGAGHADRQKTTMLLIGTQSISTHIHALC